MALTDRTRNNFANAASISAFGALMIFVGYLNGDGNSAERDNCALLKTAFEDAAKNIKGDFKGQNLKLTIEAGDNSSAGRKIVLARNCTINLALGE